MHVPNNAITEVRQMIRTRPALPTIRRFTSIALMLSGIALVSAPGLSGSQMPGDRARAVDVVICLDVSGSMQDLLDSARARVWDVVNELGRMNPTPTLRVGLISYGTDKSVAEDGWITVNADLTDDLDGIYAELMALSIGGNEEYVGQALDTAVDQMSWSPDWDVLRILFITGNESADQGADDHDFRVASKAAQDRGIIVNALYAGNREQGITEMWPEVARRGDGIFSAIDPLTGTLQIPTPQDETLLALNARLNETYLPYGERGADGLTNQLAQDANATRLGVQSCSSRIVAKGSALYTNSHWDLVDASLEDDFEWSDLANQDLPDELRGMTDEQLDAHVVSVRALREDIQTRIQLASTERENYIQSVLAREPAAAGGLGGAMLEAVREQAESKGFSRGDS
jgi:hypothetical protein